MNYRIILSLLLTTTVVSSVVIENQTTSRGDPDPSINSTVVSRATDDKKIQDVTPTEIQILQPRKSFPDICSPFISICPANTVQANDRCYRYVEVAQSWLDAKSDCERQGGFLAKPDFAYNDTAVDLSTVYRTIIGKTYIWIGATDLESVFVWKWVDGTLLDVRHPSWYPGHPGGYDKNCALIYQMKRGPLKIRKDPCQNKRHFLCQFQKLKET